MKIFLITKTLTQTFILIQAMNSHAQFTPGPWPQPRPATEQPKISPRYQLRQLPPTKEKVEEKSHENILTEELLSVPKKPEPSDPKAQKPAEEVPLLIELPQQEAPLNNNDNNLLRLSLGGTYLNMHSKSPWFARKYDMSSLGFFAQGEAWLTNQLGVSASFVSTFSTHVVDDPDGTVYTSAVKEWLTGGLVLRRNFFQPQKEATVRFGLDYLQSNFRASGSSLSRRDWITDGIRFNIDLEQKISSNHSLLFGLELSPVLKHRERGGNRDAGSGRGIDSNLMGLYLGHQVYLSERFAYFWKTSVRIERNQFSGWTESEDPFKETFLRNIPVEQTYFFLKTGLLWGD